MLAYIPYMDPIGKIVRKMVRKWSPKIRSGVEKQLTRQGAAWAPLLLPLGSSEAKHGFFQCETRRFLKMTHDFLKFQYLIVILIVILIVVNRV